jgi:hypothetical protein
MNIIKFNGKKNVNFVFCMIDITHTITDPWIKEITKNQSDYTISNLCLKGYTVLQGTDEDQLIKHASENFDYACVFSTGTEFINGDTCIVELINECNNNFFIKGHILDRNDAYYELHQQCYLINLKKYKDLSFPEIGCQSLGDSHTQIKPVRSDINIHDNYTPLCISKGLEEKTYHHKCHGWNIIKVALENNFIIEAFKDNIRKNKKHLYPESSKDFYKHLEYVYFKERYCATEFVHTNHTEWSMKKFTNIQQIVAPASGEWYKDFLSTTEPCNVILYDYNLKSLDYWSNNVTLNSNITYHFVHCDLLSNFSNLDKFIDKKLEHNTLINLSNIFCYEGTVSLSNLKYRLEKENQIIQHFKNTLPNAHLHFTARSVSGFVDTEEYIEIAKKIKVYKLSELKTPTWHAHDWI